MIANRDPGADKGARANPRALLNVNGFYDEIKRLRFVVVIAGAEKRPLRNADVAFNHNGREVQQPAFLTQPDVIAHREFPWKRDGDTRLDDHAAPDFCAKSPEHGAFQSRPFERAKPEKEQTRQNPKTFLQRSRAPVKIAGGKF